jgi:hypothetical protein
MSKRRGQPPSVRGCVPQSTAAQGSSQVRRLGRCCAFVSHDTSGTCLGNLQIVHQGCHVVHPPQPFYSLPLCVAWQGKKDRQKENQNALTNKGARQGAGPTQGAQRPAKEARQTRRRVGARALGSLGEPCAPCRRRREGAGEQEVRHRVEPCASRRPPSPARRSRRAAGAKSPGPVDRSSPHALFLPLSPLSPLTFVSPRRSLDSEQQDLRAELVRADACVLAHAWLTDPMPAERRHAQAGIQHHRHIPIALPHRDQSQNSRETATPTACCEPTRRHGYGARALPRAHVSRCLRATRSHSLVARSAAHTARGSTLRQRIGSAPARAQDTVSRGTIPCVPATKRRRNGRDSLPRTETWISSPRTLIRRACARSLRSGAQH